MDFRTELIVMVYSIYTRMNELNRPFFYYACHGQLMKQYDNVLVTTAENDQRTMNRQQFPKRFNLQLHCDENQSIHLLALSSMYLRVKCEHIIVRRYTY